MKRKAQLFAAICAWAVLGSCMRSTDSVGSAAPGMAKALAGISASLSKTPAQPLYNLEYIGSVVDPASKQPVKLPLDGELSALGWAVDPQSHNVGGGVEIAIDGRPYQAVYDLPRGDVADHFKIADYARAGFAFRAAAAAFGKGTHQVAVRILTSDKRSYYEGVPVSVRLQ